MSVERTVLKPVGKIKSAPDTLVLRSTPLRARVQPLSVAVVCLSIVFIGSFLFLAILRLRYPYEVEWLEGAFMDHVMRLRNGLPLYTRPSIDYIPYLYTPFYYYIAALSMSVFGEGFFAARLVSFVCTIASASLIFAFLYRHTSRSWILSLAGASIFIAAYGFGGYYYDVVRMDMLLVLLLLLGTFAACELRGRWSSLVPAVFLVLGFFTKQQALFVLPVVALWLTLKSRRRGIEFCVAAAVLFLAGFFYLQQSSDGWFYYYAFKITRQVGKNFHWVRSLEAIPLFVIRYWAPAIFAIILLVATPSVRFRDTLRSPLGLVFMTSAALLLSGMVSLGNDMGYVNLLIPFVAFVSILLPLTLAELERGKTLRYSVGLAIALVQLLALYYNPTSEKMVIASKHQESGGPEFLAALRAMPGEVYVPDHCYIPTLAGKKSHSHITSYFNLMEMHDSVSRELKQEFDSAFANKRFSAIILDDHGDARRDSTDGYHFARKIFTTPNIFLSRWGSGATRPDFVYLPR